MTKYSAFAIVGVLSLAGCASGFVGSTGNDTSFERVGALACRDGTTQSGLRGTNQYPLRCGPQTQTIPR